MQENVKFGMEGSFCGEHAKLWGGVSSGDEMDSEAGR
jgi:hypothetical protein